MGAVHANAFTEKLYVCAGKDYILRDSPVPYSDDTTEHSYSFNEIEEGEIQPLISWRARSLPGCCGVLVVYYLRPNRKMDVEDAAKLYGQAVDLILRAAKEAKFGMVVMSLLSSSYQALQILEGFKFVESPFTNGKTGNDVVMLLKNLEQPTPATQAFTCD